MIGGQLFGLPIARVQDVFVPERLTRVPLAPAGVAGMLNLRGRIVTAIDMRRRLDLDKRASGQPVMAIGIELQGESYGLLIDAVGEVMKFPNGAARPIRSISTRVWRACRPACIGSRASCWWFSMSTACSICESAAALREAAAAGVRVQRGVIVRGVTSESEGVMKTCLVVDDSSVIRKVARRILEGLDFQIVEAEDGEQALERLPAPVAGRGAARLEHAEDGRLRVPAGAAPAAGRRPAEGGVLHHRERCRPYRPRAARRRQ